MEIIIFLIVLLIQFANGNTIAYFLFFSSSIIIFLLKGPYIIQFKNIFLIFLYSLLLLMLIRPLYINSSLVHLELFWLSSGFISILLATALQHLSLEKTYNILKSMFLAGVIGGTIIFFLSINNIYIPGINNLPYAGVRWFGGFDGPNEYSAFYVLILALGIGLYLKGKVNFVIMLYSFLLILPTVYLSYSRGSLIILLLLLLLVLIVQLIKSKNKIFVLFVYLLGSMLGIFIIRNYKLLENFENIRANATDRNSLIEATLSMFIDRPLFGHGLGAFSDLTTISNSSPHNDYLYILVSGGVVGLVLLMIFYLQPLIKSFYYKNYAIILFLFTFYLSGIFFNNIVRGRISLLFWIVFALTLAINHQRKGK